MSKILGGYIKTLVVSLQAKPFLEKDKAIVKKILKGVQLKRPNGVQVSLKQLLGH